MMSNGIFEKYSSMLFQNVKQYEKAIQTKYFQKIKD